MQQNFILNKTKNNFNSINNTNNSDDELEDELENENLNKNKNEITSIYQNKNKNDEEKYLQGQKIYSSFMQIEILKKIYNENLEKKTNNKSFSNLTNFLIEKRNERKKLFLNPNINFLEEEFKEDLIEEEKKENRNLKNFLLEKKEREKVKFFGEEKLKQKQKLNLFEEEKNNNLKHKSQQPKITNLFVENFMTEKIEAEIEEELNDEIMNYTKNIKKYANNFTEVLGKDNKKLSQIEATQTLGKNKTDLQTKKLTEFNYSLKIGFFKILFMFLFVFSTFVWAIFIIRFFPKFA
jgi:hypothetical protein